MMNTKPQSRLPRRSQRGVVLVVALIVMAVIAITAGTAVRRVTSQDLIGSNLRSRSQALQAAESGLRYCEALVSTGTLRNEQVQLSQRIQDAVATNYLVNGQRPRHVWEDFDNWEDDNIVIEVPVTYSVDASGVDYNQRPTCIIERLALQNLASDATTPTQYEAFLITARGFSPDFEFDDGVTTRGAEVWVQSTVQVTGDI